MLGRPFVVNWREKDTTDALKAAYQRERDPKLRTRLQGLWFLRSGWRLARVAEAVGVHYRTVQSWVSWYREGGVPTVLSHKMGGRGQESFLTTEQTEELAQEVATGRFRTAAEIRDWISDQYGVPYKVSGVYSLMERMKCGPKTPRPMHEKADPEQQASWKKGGSTKPLRRQG